MNRLLGNRSKPATDDDVAIDYNECVAEIKKENPYIGHLALQQEAMKRVAQRRAARQKNNHQNGKEDFTPQRIAFRRKPSRTNKNNESNSPSQSLSRSFIGFLSSSTNTVKTSNKGLAAESEDRSNHSHNLMAGRRTSTYNEDDAAHTVAIAHAMGDIELSDSDEDDKTSDTNSRRSSLSRKLSSLRGKMTRRQSSVKRRTSTDSSISTLQRQSSELSKDSTIEKSVESTTDDDSKLRHKPQTNGDKAEENGDKKEEEEILDFVEDFLAKGGTVHSGRASVTKARSRRGSLFSVEENKSCEAGSVSKSITSLGDGSSFVAADGSLICSWGRGSMNESELMGGDGGDLICTWESRRSLLSNSSANFSSPDGSSERKKLPREIKVASKPDDR